MNPNTLNSFFTRSLCDIIACTAVAGKYYSFINVDCNKK